MPRSEWSSRRERQYEHVQASVRGQGRSAKVAGEIAARTVNKQRARSGESEQRSSSSTQDISSGRRGGLRSHRGPGGRTKDQLYGEAKRRNIRSRSKMSKAELIRALGSR
ncbi:MAG: plasmid stabilization protein [Candidatus Dormibacteria bacterium]